MPARAPWRFLRISAVLLVATLSTRPAWADTADAGQSLLTPAELEGKSLRELTILRNTPFARAGRGFETRWLQRYFLWQSWYRRGGFSEAKLSAIDRKNIDAVTAFERALSKDELAKRLAALEGRYRHSTDDPGSVLDFSPDGKFLVTGSNALGVLRVFSVPSGRLALLVRTERVVELLEARFSAKGDELLARGVDGDLRGIDARWTFPGGKSLGLSPRVENDGPLRKQDPWWTGTKSSVRRLEPGTGKVLMELSAPDLDSFAIARDAGVALVTQTGPSSAIRVLDLTTGRELRSVPGAQFERRLRAVSDDGRLAVQRQVIELETGRAVLPPTPPTLPYAAAFSPDGRWLALAEETVSAGPQSHALRLVDLASMAFEPRWRGHEPPPDSDEITAIELELLRARVGPRADGEPVLPPRPPPGKPAGSLLDVPPEPLRNVEKLDRDDFALELPDAVHVLEEPTASTRLRYSFDTVDQYSMVLVWSVAQPRGKQPPALTLVDGEEAFVPLTPEAREHVVKTPYGELAERCSRPAPGRLTCRVDVRLPSKTVYVVVRDRPDAELPLYSAIVRSIR